MSISGEEIKQARERHQLTQQDLADLVGVSLRTVGSWERGESIPRNRLGAVREALHMDGEERDGRQDLARLIREQLESDGVGSESFTKRLSERNRRPFYSWLSGSAAPQAKNRAELEDALAWERGSVSRILDAPITERITLSEVRDWAQVGEPTVPVARASQLSTDELLVELTRRVGALQSENDQLKQSGDVVQFDRKQRGLYDLAAHNADHMGRNTEHLEDE